MPNTIKPKRSDTSRRASKTLDLLEKMVKLGHAREERETSQKDYEVIAYFLDVAKEEKVP